MFVRNCWYVAAWDYEIGADALFERKILGHSILFFRNAEGTVVALDNRCCHRSAPLSLGRKEGDCVRCMYHGLKFDQTGRCVEVPGQSATPASLKVKAYPVITSTRWVWIWMGEVARADASLIPATPALSSPEWRMKPGYLLYKAHHLLISDNLLDFSHLSYVHAGTLGGSGKIAETRPEVEKLERGVKITRRIPNTVLAPYQRCFSEYSGLINRHFVYEYLVPGILLMDSGVRAADATDGCTMDFKSCQAITPESANTTHYFFMQAHNFSIDDSHVTDTLFESIAAAFEEDRRMIEAQHALISESGAPDWVLLRFDVALAHFRKIMEALSSAESMPNGQTLTRTIQAPLE